jgi:hypothetical protein
VARRQCSGREIDTARARRGHRGWWRAGCSAAEGGSRVSQLTKRRGRGKKSAATGTDAAGGSCALLAVLGGVILLVSMCSSESDQASNDSTPSSSGGAGEVAYVEGRSVNCRAEPTRKAAVRSSLVQGQSATVLERSDDWTKVSNLGNECWISSSLLSATPTMAAAAASGASAQGLLSSTGERRSSRSRTDASSSRTKKKARRSSTTRSRPSGAYSGSGCPCSGANVCIGPRGGRYCITSGGNKRYGV